MRVLSEDRREFMKAAAFSAVSWGRIAGANDRIRLGAIATGGRTQFLMRTASQVGGCDIVAVCDVYEPRRLEAKAKLAPQAEPYLDYRQLLERKDIDAVLVGSPDHWHVPMAVDAVRAGKDVYVEKPLTHRIEEGELAEKAVAETGRIVQVGYQQRSWDLFKQGADIVASGRLGRITLVLASWYQNYLNWDRTRLDKLETDKLDWKKWLGSAPDQPVNPMRYLRWRWFWDFGGGHLTDLYSHWIDVIHWYMGVDTPQAVQAMGNTYVLDYMECPDTISASYEYGKFTAAYNGTLSGHLDGGNLFFRGTRAMLKINRDGLAVYPEGVVLPEKTQYPEPEIQARATEDGAIAHMKNFLDCVRSRKQPAAPVAAGVSAARAAHLGNQALRRGARVTT